MNYRFGNNNAVGKQKDEQIQYDPILHPSPPNQITNVPTEYIFTIGILVFAVNENECRTTARSIYDRLCKQGYRSGYFVSSRKIKDEDDQEIDSLLDKTKNLFKQNLSKIKSMLSKYRIDDIFELMEFLNQNPMERDEFQGISRAFIQCSLLPSSKAVYLFDASGEPLFTKIHLYKMFREWRPVNHDIWLVLFNTK